MISNNRTLSANVKLHLHALGQCFELGQLGPDFAILHTAREIGATEGKLETVIDGKSTRWKIRITSPITTASPRFTFEAVE